MLKSWIVKRGSRHATAFVAGQQAGHRPQGGAAGRAISPWRGSWQATMLMAGQQAGHRPHGGA
eukprot:313610-Chlamydomonas_euryale.AAC.1